MTKIYETPELRKWLSSRPEVGVLNKKGGGLKFYTNFPFTEVAAFETVNEDKIIKIPNIDSFVGDIPNGYDLVEYAKGTNPEEGLCLYGFDELGMFGLYNPQYAFVKDD